MEHRTISYHGKEIEYDIIKSKRKTMGIIVSKEGKVTVRIPSKLSSKDIEKVILDKMPWIVEKVDEMKARTRVVNQIKQENFKDGASVLFQGVYYPLHIQTEKQINKIHITFSGTEFFVRTSIDEPDVIREAFVAWYRNAAKVIFKERVEFYNEIIKKPYNTIRIKEQKTCYGSCSSKGNLNFNWRCILAPQEIVDYVVVHEMCHLIHMNHSTSFWNELEKILPDYKERRFWLREKGKFLEI